MARGWLINMFPEEASPLDRAIRWTIAMVVAALFFPICFLGCQEPFGSSRRQDGERAGFLVVSGVLKEVKPGENGVVFLHFEDGRVIVASVRANDLPMEFYIGHRQTITIISDSMCISNRGVIVSCESSDYEKSQELAHD